MARANVPIVVCARQYVPSSPREPLLEAAFSRPPGHEVRRRIRAWASAVAVRLGDLGFREEGSAPGPDDEAGSPLATATRVTLARIDGPEDSVHKARPRVADGAVGDGWRARVVLVIDDVHVEVAAELSVVAASAARARIGDPVRALELTTTLESLPEQFAIGLTGDKDPGPAVRATTDQLRLLLDRAERDDRPLWLGWSIPRDVAIAHAALLDEQLEDAVVALGSALAVLSPAHDAGAALGMGAVRTKRDKRHGSAVSDDEGRGAKRRALAREEDEAERRDQGAAEPEPPREQDRAPRPAQRTAVTHAKGRGGGRERMGRRVTAGGAVALGPPEKGTRVRVLEGPFAGKVGSVQDLDGKGGARVMLGLLAVRVDVRDLARCAEGRQRPILSTSHRKPPPARS